MTSYRTIVLSICKEPELFQDRKEQVFDLLQSYKNIIVAFHPSTDCTSQWPHDHWHIIYEPETTRYDNEARFKKIQSLAEANGYFSSQKVRKLETFLMYITMPPRKWLFGHGDVQKLHESLTEEDRQAYYQKRETYKQNSSTSGSNIPSSTCSAESTSSNPQQTQRSKNSKNLQDIIKMIEVSTPNGISNMINFYHKHERLRPFNYFDILAASTFKSLFDKAVDITVQITLTKTALELACDFLARSELLPKLKDKYLPFDKSVDLLISWCSHQGISFDAFCLEMISVFDKKNPKLNSLILQGQANSGKTYILSSLRDLSIYYGEVYQGTAGNNFMWNDCVSKRMIIIEEPFFDMCAIEQLKLIMEGRDTKVNIKNKNSEMLQRTPVYISSNRDIWHYASAAKQPILARCYYHNGLKSFDYLADIKLPLNPGIWGPIAALLRFTSSDLAAPLSHLCVDDDKVPTDPDTLINQMKKLYKFSQNCNILCDETLSDTDIDSDVPDDDRPGFGLKCTYACRHGCDHRGAECNWREHDRMVVQNVFSFPGTIYGSPWTDLTGTPELEALPPGSELPETNLNPKFSKLWKRRHQPPSVSAPKPEVPLPEEQQDPPQKLLRVTEALKDNIKSPTAQDPISEPEPSKECSPTT